MADQAAFNLLLLFSTRPCGTSHAKTTALLPPALLCSPNQKQSFTSPVYLVVSSQEYYPCVQQVLFFPVLLFSATIHLEVSFLLRNHKMTWCWAAYWVSYGVPDKILLKFSDNILLWIFICHFLKSCQTLKLFTVKGISIFTFEHWSLDKLFFASFSSPDRQWVSWKVQFYIREQKFECCKKGNIYTQDVLSYP
jgi:hypothetical protein